MFFRAGRDGSSPRGRGKLATLRDRIEPQGLIPARAGKTAVCLARIISLTAHPRAGGENCARYRRAEGTRGSSPRGRGKRTTGRRPHHQHRLIPARAGKTRRTRSRKSTPAAHPRAGGENTTVAILNDPDRGSSPRGRGKPISPRADARRPRLIPARAGKTPTPWTSPTWPPAHPRAGGENARASAAAKEYAGSSPRGRGKPSVLVSSPMMCRLIPARAGKTGDREHTLSLLTAHPRAGGENPKTRSETLPDPGSSPRGRGKPRVRRSRRRANGLIPARAGKTAFRTPANHCNSAHPRAGGENVADHWAGVISRGSSPRGRGKLALWFFNVICARLIPARAGKTCYCHNCESSFQAHPRAGGENDCSESHFALWFGSSPRGRGKRAGLELDLRAIRLIPARAGKTWSMLVPPFLSWAHPRAGGENGTPASASRSRSGSSPRGRGKPSRSGRARYRARLIPARAGKTRVGDWRGHGRWAHPRAGGEN